MAETNRLNRKPRVLKSAPTIRERAVAAREEVIRPKTGRIKAVLKLPLRLITLIRIPSNPITRAVGGVFKIIKKVLSWLVPRYFVNSWREMRLVTWPGRKETLRLTTAVFIFAVIFGAVAAVVDKGLDELFKKTVLK